MHYNRLKKLLFERILTLCYIKLKVLIYKLLSTCDNVIGTPKRDGPVLLKGEGKIFFEGNVKIGLLKSPYFYNTYSYFEARNTTSVIAIGLGTHINNNACIISEGEGIYIGENALIGPNFVAYDSDFHSLDPMQRISGPAATAKITIGKNVFIGSNVTVLKGVTIGDNSVIGSNSVVSKNVSANAIAVGNPCKEVKKNN